MAQVSAAIPTVGLFGRKSQRRVSALTAPNALERHNAQHRTGEAVDLQFA